ncbi:MAG TPA: galactokinase [Pyrinomonadaceae bacterium]|nr:galactokinase [Pyrinomonadaceae bacterium]
MVSAETMVDPQELAKAFAEVFSAQPRIFRAPGRVNLIGEHTDYNEGFVMPAAINYSTFVAIAPCEDRVITVRSDHFPDTAELNLDRPTQSRKHWSDYPLGVAVKLEEAGHRLQGANLLIRGDVPIGSGLSSSAAIEVSTALALLHNAGLSLDRLELAKVCQKAENEFVGIRSGLMDQFIACFGEKDHAVMLDCRSLESTPLPLPEGVKLVACNTMVKHQLASSEYNSRREECEEGVRILSKHLPKIKSLREVSIEDLERYGSELPEVVYRRCRHVITENDRVVRAATALRNGELSTFGRLMAQSHQSLRDDYEVSCEELDLMVEFAHDAPDCLGARMTGGGFGGATINLVRAAAVEQFAAKVGKSYTKATNIQPEIYVCSAADGAERVL